MKTSSICIRTLLSCALLLVAVVASADSGPPLPPLPTLPKTPAAPVPPAPSSAPKAPGPSLSSPVKPAPLPRSTPPAPRATQPAPVNPVAPLNPPTQTAPAPAPAPADSGSYVPPAPSGNEPEFAPEGAEPPRRRAAGYQPAQGVDPSLYYADAAPYGGRYPQPVGSPYYYNPDWNYNGGNAYDIHFGPGFYRSNEYGHLRFPFYSYRRPWYTPGPAVYVRDTNLAW